MTEEKRKLIYSMFSSIGHEVMHNMAATSRGDILWKYENQKDYLNLVQTKQPKCIIYDYRRRKLKNYRLYLKSYVN